VKVASTTYLILLTRIFLESTTENRKLPYAYY
jgi:hypothetical protein